MEKFRDILSKYFYGFVLFFTFFYYLFFSKPAPGFWEKVLMVLIGLIISVFYSLNFTISKKHFVLKAGGIVKTFFISLMLPLIIALCEYLALLIFFGKNPPVVVGIPYSIYSFSVGKLLYSGYVYNFIFYYVLISVLTIIKSDTANK